MWGSISRLRRYISFRKFDVSTEDGRSAERHRRIALTVIAAGAARATSVVTALVTVPLTFHYLGPERYGMWMTMSAFIAALAFADFGIGNGVLTAVSRASGRDELALIRKYVSSAFLLLGAVAMAVLGALLLLYEHVSWDGVFNVSGELARAEAAPAIAILIVCFALSLPLGIVQRVQMGLQMGFMASIWQCIASLAALAGVTWAVWMKAGLPWLVAGFAGIPVIVSMLNTCVFFGRLRPNFAPIPSQATLAHSVELGRIGFLFFILQMAVAATYTSDNLVIAQALGAQAVAAYSVPDRLFAISSMLVGLLVAPLWPAFGESLARGDHKWAKRTLLRTTLISACIAGGLGVALVVAAPTLVRLWVGTDIHAPLALMLGFALWRTIESSVGATSVYLNASGVIRLQVATATITAAVAITLKCLLAPRLGSAVIPWVTVFAYLLFTALPTWWVLRRMLGNNSVSAPNVPI